MKKISYELVPLDHEFSTRRLRFNGCYSVGENVEITKICSGAEPASWHSSTVIRNSPAI